MTSEPYFRFDDGDDDNTVQSKYILLLNQVIKEMSNFVSTEDSVTTFDNIYIYI